jgi:hypothetical protein
MPSAPADPQDDATPDASDLEAVNSSWAPSPDGNSETERLALVADAARPLLNRLTGDEKRQMLNWFRMLVELRNAPLTRREKARSIARSWSEVGIVLPILREIGRIIKERVWDGRSWSFRLSVGAAAITVSTVGGKKAGLALLGTAVAVPLWVVFGAGAAFAGLIIQELQSMLPIVARRGSMQLDESPIVSLPHSPGGNAEQRLLPRMPET